MQPGGVKIEPEAPALPDEVEGAGLLRAVRGRGRDDVGLVELELDASGELWGDLSGRYAGDASGTPTAYVHRDDTGGFYYNRELPRLDRNPDVGQVNQVDPVSGTTTHPLPLPKP